MESSPKLSSGALADDLRGLGVCAGDLLMVHASMRRIGPVDGGARGLLDVLARVVGPAGTIVMVLGADDPLDWVNERPEPERAALLAGSEPFDALMTPADPDVGVLAEVFRTQPRTVVSDHPDGRFAASGPMAEELITDVPWHDYYGTGSPLERIAAAGAKILRLGADMDTLTILHLAEQRCAVSDKRRVRRHHLVLGADGLAQVRVVETLDDSNGIVDHPGEDYFITILREYLDAGRAGVGTVGRAPAELMDANALVDFGVAWMNAHLAGGHGTT